MSAIENSDEQQPVLIGRLLKDEEDYTYYVANPKAKGAQELIDRDSLKLSTYDDYDRLIGKAEHSSDCGKKIEWSKGDGNKGKDCRVLACRCYAGKAIAVTMRRVEKANPADEWDKPRPRLDKKWEASGNDYARPPKPSDPPFAVPISAICDLIDPLAFEDQKLAGLVLVAGSTNSAKSELTRGLIDRILRRQLKDGPKRPPHLVTYEDPIEKYLFKDFVNALEYGVEYTPRQKKIDVRSLKRAFDDALRQTPSVFYVGEVREDADWKELVRFAGTGHLVVATAHAGSLIEAMERIFRGVEAKTPAERGQVAQKILTVVHQRKFDLAIHAVKDPITGKKELTPGAFEILLPSVWRRTPGGVAALISDGLSSVLPNNPNEAGKARTSSFGRRWFAKQLVHPEDIADSLKSWESVAYEHRLREDFKAAINRAVEGADTDLIELAKSGGYEKVLANAVANVVTRQEGDVARAREQAVNEVVEDLRQKYRLQGDKAAKAGDPTRDAAEEARIVELIEKVETALKSIATFKATWEAAGKEAERAREIFQKRAIGHDLQGV